MIDDPPLLTIRRRFARPDPTLVDALRGVQTGFVVDGMDGSGALHHRIKPIDPALAGFVGVAVTCDCGPADNLALFAALDIAGPGDVLVCATNAYEGTAVVGDLMAGMARNKGVVALVTDGLVRDQIGLRQVGLPVFAAGVTPNSPARQGPGAAGLPIMVGGVSVASGDVLVGDLDGVVVIPRERLAAVVERLVVIREKEAALDAAVRGGLTMSDFARRILDSDRVRSVD
ncbi:MULTISPECIES: RraA family protein [unclassified Inquilinus]|uniref:RraA family protein n=1 Tax=unclassified Inquilinus TaxID=2645927 RepID=UPI003F93D5D2